MFAFSPNPTEAFSCKYFAKLLLDPAPLGESLFDVTGGLRFLRKSGFSS